jgi:hypothetical protein
MIALDVALAGLIAIYCAELEKHHPRLTAGTMCLICIAVALAVKLLAKAGFNL